MTRRYIVIASPTKRGLIYLIYDTLNQVSIESGYGCEKWAQRQADILEGKAEMTSEDVDAVRITIQRQ